MLQSHELDGATERFLIDHEVPAFFNARQVRARASQLVRRHATRLGLDPFAASAIVSAIEAIPAEGDA